MSKEETIMQEVQITTLSDVEHVRQRRGMYLPNMNYCVYEIVDNAVDEFMAGYCKNIYVQITPDKVLRVQDDGRGIPLTPSKDDPTKTMAEIALGHLKSGGKFNAEGSMIEQGIKTGGLNGTGASAVNFTCEQFVATITKNGKQYALGWEKGQLTTPLTELGQVEEDDLQNGTLIELIPDMSIWVDDDYNIKDIVKRLEQLTFLNPGLTIYVDIDYNGKKINETYCNPEGLKSYIDKLSTGKEVIIEPIHDSFELESDKFGKVDVDIALGYNNAFNEEVYTFTNNVPNPLGGHHLTGFKQGLFASINNYYEENTKGKLVTLTQDDVREGIISVISVKVSNPVFDGQGKAKLNMPGIRGLVKQAVEELMNDYLDKNPNYAKIIIAKALQAQSTREAIRKTREAERGTKKTLVGVPDKLSDCAEKSPEKSELWLAEGDSAGGSCKKARFNNQAILPIFGKINNVEKGNILNVLESEKLKDVVKALKTGIGEEFDIDNLRYHKIIIAADADVDGLHIQTLWITFFYRFMRQIIENGHLYISCPPLYKVVKNKNTFEYCYTDEEKDKLVKEYGKCEVFRYKGLGEMDAKDLKYSTMDPENRVLIQVNIEDLEYDEMIISTCMGDDVAARKRMILDDELGELM